MAFKTLKSIDDNVAFHAVEDICVLTYVRITLTFIQWPWYSNLTKILWRCTCTPKIKFLSRPSTIRVRTGSHTETDVAYEAEDAAFASGINNI